MEIAQYAAQTFVGGDEPWVDIMPPDDYEAARAWADRWANLGPDVRTRVLFRGNLPRDLSEPKVSA